MPKSAKKGSCRALESSDDSNDDTTIITTISRKRSCDSKSERNSKMQRKEILNTNESESLNSSDNEPLSIEKDIKNILHSRKQLFLQYANGVMNAYKEKCQDLNIFIKNDGKQTYSEFKKCVATLYNEWNFDMEKCREKEEKLIHLIDKKLHVIKEKRDCNKERLQQIHLLTESFLKNGQEENTVKNYRQQKEKELEKQLQDHCNSIMYTIRQQAMANMKKSMKRALFSNLSIIDPSN